jgi:hypothetical protein
VAQTTESNKGDLKRRLAQKALMPIVATAASAAAGYVAKKGPHIFEEKVLPKLKQTGSGAGDVAGDLPSRAKDAASSVGGLASRAKDAVPLVGSSSGEGGGGGTGGGGGGGDGGGDSGGGGNGGGGKRRNGLSASQLDKHTKQRAEARAARRKATRR